ncbi:sugar phosphate isomerase/epimerase family protein [Paenibacillus nasutitermitis]|uniref:sugar phosphate isomerase/epimerase family protein n=1 Tax=Paenibacillus nasutitermitis TaxID=1652958 RepID=UPI00166AC81F
MKLSVFTVATADVTPEELCREAAAAGIEGIEWRCKEISAETRLEAPSFWGNNHSTLSPLASEEEIGRFKQAVDNYGRKTLALAPYIQCGDLETTERIFKLANRMDASMVRVGVPAYNRTRSYNELYDQAVVYLQEVEVLAKEHNLKALVETHHYTIAPSASLAHRLVSGFNPDHIGVIYDPGNMVHEGYENFRLGLELLGPYLAHVHVKNAGWLPAGGDHPNSAAAAVQGTVEGDSLQPIDWTCSWRPIASGVIPWKQVLTDLKAVKYDGWLGLEDFSGTYNTVTMLAKYAQQMNQWMEEIE